MRATHPHICGNRALCLTKRSDEEPMEVDVKVTEHPNVPESDKERELVIDLNNTADNMKMVECDLMIDPNGVKKNVSGT